MDLSSDNAKLQVSAGMNALKNGKVTMTEGKDVSFTVSGLRKKLLMTSIMWPRIRRGNYSGDGGKDYDSYAGSQCAHCNWSSPSITELTPLPHCPIPMSGWCSARDSGRGDEPEPV